MTTVPASFLDPSRDLPDAIALLTHLASHSHPREGELYRLVFDVLKGQVAREKAMRAFRDRLGVPVASRGLPAADEDPCPSCGHDVADHVDNGDGPTCARMIVSSIRGGADECGCRLASPAVEAGEPCVCDPNPDTTDGPCPECPRHGIDRETLRWLHAVGVASVGDLDALAEHLDQRGDERLTATPREQQDVPAVSGVGVASGTATTVPACCAHDALRAQIAYSEDKYIGGYHGDTGTAIKAAAMLDTAQRRHPGHELTQPDGTRRDR